MYIREDEALQRISERVRDNTAYVKESLRQRRDEFTDHYGDPHYAFGDGSTPAKVYISVSTDLIYWMRFEFKLIVRPFVSFVSGSGTQDATVEVEDTSLTVAETNHAVRPNPHHHTTKPHNHNMIPGVALFHTSSDEWRLTMKDPCKGSEIDITLYLKAQYNEWINGEGIYPSCELNERYDLLQVASDLEAEGQSDLADEILRPGYKEIDIYSNAPFFIELDEYTKYNNLGR